MASKMCNPFVISSKPSMPQESPPTQGTKTETPKPMEKPTTDTKKATNEPPEGYIDVEVNGRTKRRLKTYHDELIKPKTVKELRAERKAKRKTKTK